MGLKGKRVPSSRLVELLRERYQSTIDDNIETLVTMALMRLAGDVGYVAVAPEDTTQLELFEEYGVNRHAQIWFKRGGKWEHLHANLDTLNSRELRDHAGKIASRKRPVDRTAGYLKLADEMDEVKKSDDFKVMNYLDHRRNRKAG